MDKNNKIKVNGTNSVVEAEKLEETQYQAKIRLGHTYQAAKARFGLSEPTAAEIANEAWRQVPMEITNGAYREASTLGRIRNKKGHILKPQTNFVGALLVPGKRNSNGRLRMTQVSRMVFFAFNPAYVGVDFAERMDIDHIDCDKTNNRPSNLRLISHARNTRRAWTPVRIEDTVYPTIGVVASEYGVNVATVRLWIRKGYTPSREKIDKAPDYKSQCDGLTTRCN